ncbi:hypothetical protein [Microlunatus soli]|uniref:Low temperature requirement A protein (LtrA) n=1 Tax=Microlunatus soli TaxID=630515 RepID=A0A1H1Z7M9_9ACTN|nr:hypothetical protein [Microlunatus soli]SDT29708.1 hypothetical protein SAMN04489812_5040 [Microlunatus soli]
MLTPRARLLVGGLTGLIGLVAMVRLVGAGFPGSMLFAEIFVALAMVPWVVYSAVRAHHGDLDVRTVLPVAVIAAAGFLLVWWATIGPVLALGCSLAAFVIIWLHDLPPKKPKAERLVKIDELTDSHR